MIKRIMVFACALMLSTLQWIPALAAGSETTQEPVNTETAEYSRLLDGSTITMLAGSTQTQIVSFMIETVNGSIIVVDGGLNKDAPKLAKMINEKGGRVDAWFLTHAHEDHSGALAEIIRNNGAYNIAIGKIYYSFPDADWAYRSEPSSFQDFLTIQGALDTLPESMKQSVLKKDDIFQIDNISVKVLNEWDPSIRVDAINNTSVVYSMEIGSKRMIFLGDLGVEGGKKLLANCTPEELKCDIVQMAHHGQASIGQEVYEAMKPDICMWPTPTWLWNNNNGNGKNTGTFTTLTTRKWMSKLQVKTHYISKDGDQVIR